MPSLFVPLDLYSYEEPLPPEVEVELELELVLVLEAELELEELLEDILSLRFGMDECSCTVFLSEYLG